MPGKKKSAGESGTKKKKPFYKRVWFWILVLLVIGIGMGGNDEEPSEEQTTEGQSESQTIEQEAPEMTPDEIKEDAKEKNSIIYSTVLSVEDQYKSLLNTMESGDLLETYNASEDLETLATECWGQINDYEDDLNGDYITACQDYFIQLSMICDDIQDYLNKQEMKYLSSAQEKVEGLSAYTLNVVSCQMTYLVDAGFTDEEIAQILEQ